MDATLLLALLLPMLLASSIVAAVAWFERNARRMGADEMVRWR